MDPPMTQPSSGPLADRFLAATARPYKPRHAQIDDAEYLEMLWRMVRALERRAIDNPENLTQVIELANRLGEVVNVVIAANAERYEIDPKLGASMAECARILGITKQSASRRRARGVAVLDERITDAGGTRFAEAARERAAIAAATEHAVIELAAWRARKRPA